jgi:multiple sugar transport system substrate-binding protein/sorbitol/mannitol transport system substrate-binding protein
LTGKYGKLFAAFNKEQIKYFFWRKVMKKKNLVGFLFGLTILLMGARELEARGGSQQQGGGTVNLAIQSHTALQALANYYAEFEQQTGIKVVPDESPQDQLSQKILLDLSSGTGAYDIVGIHYIWLAGWAEPGWLQPIDDYIAKEKANNTAVFDYNDFVLPEMFAYKGKQYGLPFYGESQMLYYNKEIFAAAGLPDRGPETWDEVIEFCKAVKERTDKAGFAMRGIADNRAILNTWHIFAFSNGWTGWLDSNGRPQFDRPEAVEAARYYADLLNTYGPAGIASYNWPDVQTLMQQGLVAMIIDATNFGPRLEAPSMSTIGGKVGYGLVPKSPKGLRKPGITAYGLYIPKASKNHDAAWTFMNWSLSKDLQLKTALNGVRDDVTRNSVMANPDYIRRYAVSNYLDMKTQAINDGILHFPYIVPMQEVAAELSITLNKILVGGDAATLMRELNTRVTGILAASN